MLGKPLRGRIRTKKTWIVNSRLPPFKLILFEKLKQMPRDHIHFTGHEIQHSLEFKT